jgi:hypothetical protein
MDRIEHIDKYINYVFNSNYPSFNLESEVVALTKDYLEVKFDVVSAFNSNRKTNFKIRFDDNNFFIEDENMEWKQLSIASNFDNVLFKILFFKLFFGTDRNINEIS